MQTFACLFFLCYQIRRRASRLACLVDIIVLLFMENVNANGSVDPDRMGPSNRLSKQATTNINNMCLVCHLGISRLQSDY